MLNLDDRRVVLAINAASVSARVSVAKDGTVKGHLSKKWTDEAEKICLHQKNFLILLKKMKKI